MANDLCNIGTMQGTHGVTAMHLPEKKWWGRDLLQPVISRFDMVMMYKSMSM